MNTKITTIALVFILIISTIEVNAQTFSLSTFESARKQLKNELNLTETKVHKLEKSYALLDSQLLKLNDEIIGKNKEQVKKLIQKKFEQANKNVSNVLTASEFKQIQILNSKQMTTITKGLIGTNGLIYKNGSIGENGVIVNVKRRRIRCNRRQ